MVVHKKHTTFLISNFTMTHDLDTSQERELPRSESGERVASPSLSDTETQDAGGCGRVLHCRWVSAEEGHEHVM